MSYTAGARVAKHKLYSVAPIVTCFRMVRVRFGCSCQCASPSLALTLALVLPSGDIVFENDNFKGESKQVGEVCTGGGVRNGRKDRKVAPLYNLAVRLTT